MSHHKWIFLISITVLLLTGCWDTINIEDRGFIVGSAIDLAEDDPDDPIYSITNQFVLPQSFINPAEQASDQKAFDNITGKGQAVSRVNEEMSANSSKTPYFGHIKMLIISEELAKQEGTLINLLDHYIRDVKIRRGTHLIVSKGDAKEVLGFQQPEGDLPAINLMQLLDNSSDRSGFFQPLVLGEVQEHFINNRSFILPYFTIDDQLKWSSGAVYQGPEEKIVGLINGKELQGLDIFSGKGIQSIIDFKYKKDTFALKNIRIKRKLSIDTTNIDKLKIKNKLSLEGVINESYSKENFLNPKELRKVEKSVSKDIEELLFKVTDKAQQELNADIFNIWRQLETKHYDTWKKVKNDWESGENYFSKADFDIEVNTDIYSTGTTNKTD